MFVVGDALRWNRRRYPSKIAVVDEAGSRTWAELADRSWALANGLRAAGIRPGDHVGVLTGNSNWCAEVYLGVAAAGAVAVFYNNLWAGPELVFGINSTEARLILVERDCVEQLDRAMACGQLDLVQRIVTQGPDYEELLRSGGAPPVTVTPDDPNVILFTGGTTGFSKGVVLSHRNVLANCFNEIVDTDMEHDDRTLIITPMFHSASLLCWFLPHVVVGATTVFQRRFDEEAVAAVIARERVTNGFLVPNMVRRMLASGALERYDLSSLRRLYVGGATFRMPDKQAVRELLPDARTYYQYGLTEAGPIVTRLRPEDMLREDLDGSIGREFLLNEVSIRNDDDQEVEAGLVGEICVRGPNVMVGYYGQPEETARALRGGWLRTGDLAASTAEGYLFFHDRSKDMIKSGGENVYSQEVEQVLYSHPGVAEAAVVGVPSVEWDEEVRAVVALRSGAVLSEQELRDFCGASLARYKVPKRIAFVDALPVSPSGKIVKAELRELDHWS